PATLDFPNPRNAIFLNLSCRKILMAILRFSLRETGHSVTDGRRRPMAQCGGIRAGMRNPRRVRKWRLSGWRRHWISGDNVWKPLPLEMMGHSGIPGKFLIRRFGVHGTVWKVLQLRFGMQAD